jgi:hypothetical protein
VNKLTLVDTNVLLDVFTDDPVWADWSSKALIQAASEGQIGINPLIYAEISVGFKSAELLDQALNALGLQRWPLPYAAAWPAARAFVRYRKQRGERRPPLPAFYIGAHAAVEALRLLSRDRGRYGTYFPMVDLICP